MATGKLTLVLGIRPDVIRAALIIRALTEQLGPRFEFVWSGQHYSDNLKDVFFRQLEVPPPHVELGVKGSNDHQIIADMVWKLGNHLATERSEVVVFLGDTNTVCGALAAASLNIPIVHIEGCMRSYDWRMPEEKYRTVVDHLADLIYAYLPSYAEHGLAEGIPPGRIVLTGNPIVDILEYYFVSGRIRMATADRLSFLGSLGVSKDDFVLMTSHRRENVEDGAALGSILRLASKTGRTVVFPAGYRTQRELKRQGIGVPANIRMLDPIGYVEFLELLDASRGVLTDSGTVVEEASILMKPTVQMRRSTERPEVYDVGGAVRFDPGAEWLDVDLERVVGSFDALSEHTWRHSLGDGHASERIIGDLIARLEGSGFRNHEPIMEDPLVTRAFSGP